MSITKTTFGNQLPESYEELVRVYLPRPLHDDVDYQNACEVMGFLAIHGEDGLNEDQKDYLEIVSNMIEIYDRQHDVPGELDAYRGINALKHLCELHNISGAKLSRILGLSDSAGRKILGREYNLTLTNMRKLGEYFSVSPQIFMDLDGNNPKVKPKD